MIHNSGQSSPATTEKEILLVLMGNKTLKSFSIKAGQKGKKKSWFYLFLTGWFKMQCHCFPPFSRSHMSQNWWFQGWKSDELPQEHFLAHSLANVESKAGQAVKKWGKVSLRGRAQVTSREPLLSLHRSSHSALFGLFHHNETLGLLWLRFILGNS